MRRRDRRNKRPITIAITSAVCFLILMTAGYATFSTNLNITAKGNIVKNPLIGSINEVITNLVTKNTDELYTDENGNIRYYGKSPNNYVYFNCTDKNNQSNETCELWRIIGIVDGKVKIIKNDSIGDMQWNTTDNNNWDNSSLKAYLNGEYYNSINAPYKNMISINETFYLGGATSSNYQTLTAKGYYDVERDGAQVYSGNPATTNQNIGLMYPSDYGYAAGESCLTTALWNYNTSCKDSDWLYSGEYVWLQAPSASIYYVAALLSDSGFVDGAGPTVGNEDIAVRPSLYLKSDIEITDGDGSQNNPFQLSI